MVISPCVSPELRLLPHVSSRVRCEFLDLTIDHRTTYTHDALTHDVCRAAQPHMCRSCPVAPPHSMPGFGCAGHAVHRNYHSDGAALPLTWIFTIANMRTLVPSCNPVSSQTAPDEPGTWQLSPSHALVCFLTGDPVSFRVRMHVTFRRIPVSRGKRVAG